MSIALADLSLLVDASTVTQAQEKIVGLGKSVDDFGKNSQKSLSGANAAMAAVGVAATGLLLGFKSAVSSAEDFQKQMSEVGAVSGASAGQMKQLSDLALQLGKDTSFSASEAAQGLSELVKGGISIQDIMQGAAKATLNLAAAGGIDLASAAQIASNALNTFGLSGKDMAHVADLIAGAANASAISVQDFQFSLSSSGAVAKAAGVSLDDLTVAIAELGNQGIKGQDAGTSLKTMMLALIAPTTQATLEMQSLGIVSFNTQKAMDYLRAQGIAPAGTSADVLQDQFKALAKEMAGHNATAAQVRQTYNQLIGTSGALSNSFFDQSGKLKNLSEVSGILQESLKGMTQQQQEAALKTIFGTDAIRAATIMAGQGAEGFDKLAASMGKVSAADVATQKLNNLAGDMQQLQGSLETLSIRIGTALLPALRALAQGATEVVNSVIDIVAAIPPDFLNIAAPVLASAAAVASLAGGLAVLKSGMLPFSGIIEPIIASLGAMALPIVAIGAAAAALYLAWQNDWGGIREAVAGAWSQIQPVFEQFTGGIEDIKGAFELGGLSAAFANIPSAMEPALDALGNLKDAFISWASDAVPGMLANLGDLLSQLGTWIAGVAPQIVQQVSSWVDAFTGWAQGIWPSLQLTIQTTLASMLTWIAAVAPTITDTLGSWVSAYLDWAVPLSEQILSKLEIVGETLLGWVLTAGGAIRTQVFTVWLPAFVGWVEQVAPPLLAALGDLLGQLGNWIQGTALPVIEDTVATWAPVLWGWVQDAVSPLLAALGDLAGQLLGWLGDQLTPIGNQLGQWANAFIAWVGPAGEEFLKQWPFILNNFLDWIVGAAVSIGQAIAPWALKFIEWIGPMLPGLLKGLAAIGLAIGAFLLETAITIGVNITKWAVKFVEWVAPQVPGMLLELGKLGLKLLGWIGDQIPKLLNQLAAWGWQFVDWVGPQILPLLTQLGTLATALLKWVGGQLHGIGDKLGQWADAFIHWVGDAVTKIPGELDKFGKALTDRIAQTTTHLPDELKAWASAFLDWIGPAISQIPKELDKFGAALTARIGQTTANLPKELGAWASAFVDWAGGVWKDLKVKLDAVVTDIINWIPGAAKRVVTGAKDLGGGIVDGIKKGAEDKAGELFGFLGGLPGKALNKAKDAAGQHSPATIFIPLGGGFVEGIQAGVTQALPGLVLQMGALVKSVVGTVVTAATEGTKQASVSSNELVKSGMVTPIHTAITTSLPLIDDYIKQVPEAIANDLAGGAPKVAAGVDAGIKKPLVDGAAAAAVAAKAAAQQAYATYAQGIVTEATAWYGKIGATGTQSAQGIIDTFGATLVAGAPHVSAAVAQHVQAMVADVHDMTTAAAPMARDAYFNLAMEEAKALGDPKIIATAQAAITALLAVNSDPALFAKATADSDSAIAGLATSIIAQTTSWGAKLHENQVAQARDIINGFAEGYAAGTPGVSAAVSTAAQQLTTDMKNLADAQTPLARDSAFKIAMAHADGLKDPEAIAAAKAAFAVIYAAQNDKVLLQKALDDAYQNGKGVGQKYGEGIGAGFSDEVHSSTFVGYGSQAVDELGDAANAAIHAQSEVIAKSARDWGEVTGTSYVSGINDTLPAIKNKVSEIEQATVNALPVSEIKAYMEHTGEVVGTSFAGGISTKAVETKLGQYENTVIGQLNQINQQLNQTGGTGGMALIAGYADGMQMGMPGVTQAVADHAKAIYDDMKASAAAQTPIVSYQWYLMALAEADGIKNPDARIAMHNAVVDTYANFGKDNADAAAKLTPYLGTLGTGIMTPMVDGILGGIPNATAAVQQSFASMKLALQTMGASTSADSLLAGEQIALASAQGLGDPAAIALATKNVIDYYNQLQKVALDRAEATATSVFTAYANTLNAGGPKITQAMKDQGNLIMLGLQNMEHAGSQQALDASEQILLAAVAGIADPVEKQKLTDAIMGVHDTMSDQFKAQAAAANTPGSPAYQAGAAETSGVATGAKSPEALGKMADAGAAATNAYNAGVASVPVTVPGIPGGASGPSVPGAPVAPPKYGQGLPDPTAGALPSTGDAAKDFQNLINQLQQIEQLGKTTLAAGGADMAKAAVTGITAGIEAGGPGIDAAMIARAKEIDADLGKMAAATDNQQRVLWEHIALGIASSFSDPAMAAKLQDGIAAYMNVLSSVTAAGGQKLDAAGQKAIQDFISDSKNMLTASTPQLEKMFFDAAMRDAQAISDPAVRAEAIAGLKKYQDSLGPAAQAAAQAVTDNFAKGTQVWADTLSGGAAVSAKAFIDSMATGLGNLDTVDQKVKDAAKTVADLMGKATTEQNPIIREQYKQMMLTAAQGLGDPAAIAAEIDNINKYFDATGPAAKAKLDQVSNQVIDGTIANAAQWAAHLGQSGAAAAQSLIDNIAAQMQAGIPGVSDAQAKIFQAIAQDTQQMTAAATPMLRDQFANLALTAANGLDDPVAKQKMKDSIKAIYATVDDAAQEQAAKVSADTVQAITTSATQYVGTLGQSGANAAHAWLDAVIGGLTSGIPGIDAAVSKAAQAIQTDVQKMTTTTLPAVRDAFHALALAAADALGDPATIAAAKANIDALYATVSDAALAKAKALADQTIQTLVSGTAAWSAQLGQSGAAAAQAMITSLAQGLASGMPNVSAAVSALASQVQTDVQNMLAATNPVIRDTFRDMALSAAQGLADPAAIQAATAAIQTLYGTVSDAAIAASQQASAAVVATLVSGTQSWIATLGDSATQAAQAMIDSLVTGIAQGGPAITTSVATAAQQMATAVQQMEANQNPVIRQAGFQMAMNAAAGLGDPSAIAAARAAITTLFNAVGNQGVAAMNQASNQVADAVLQAAEHWVAMLGQTGAAAAQTLLDSLISGLQAGTPGVTAEMANFANQLAQDVRNMLAATNPIARDAAYHLALAAAQGLGDPAAIKAALDAVNTLYGTVSDQALIDAAKKAAQASGSAVIQSVALGMSGATPAAVQTATGAGTAVGQGVTDAITAATPAALAAAMAAGAAVGNGVALGVSGANGVVVQAGQQIMANLSSTIQQGTQLSKEALQSLSDQFGVTMDQAGEYVTAGGGVVVGVMASMAQAAANAADAVGGAWATASSQLAMWEAKQTAIAGFQGPSQSGNGGLYDQLAGMSTAQLQNMLAEIGRDLSSGTNTLSGAFGALSVGQLSTLQQVISTRLSQGSPARDGGTTPPRPTGSGPVPTTPPYQPNPTAPTSPPRPNSTSGGSGGMLTVNLNMNSQLIATETQQVEFNGQILAMNLVSP